MAIVTGGTGLVGSRLIFDLIENGESVTALIRPQTSTGKFTEAIMHYTDSPKSITDKINWVDGNLNDIDDLLNLLNKNDEVYHCAAKVSFNPREDQNTIATNVDGTANVVNACLIKKVRKLCHVSSIGALGGKINGEKINEDTPWSASEKSAYSLSKHYSEMEVWRAIAEGLNAVIINPSVILGPGNWYNGSPRLFSLVAKGLKFYTKGGTGYIDVRDVTKAMILLMKSDKTSERYLLSSENLSYQELFTNIAQAINVKPPTKYASKTITAFAYRAESLRCTLTGKEPKLTKQTHTISHSTSKYNGAKITDSLKYGYTPIKETITFIGKCFIKDY